MPTRFARPSLSQLVPPPVGGAVGFHGLPKYTNLFWVYAFLRDHAGGRVSAEASSLGRAMISVREDEFAAQAMGVNVARVKVLAFMMAAFFAGMAGGLFAHESGQHHQPAGRRLSALARLRDHDRAGRPRLDHRRHAGRDRFSLSCPSCCAISTSTG